LCHLNPHRIRGITVRDVVKPKLLNRHGRLATDVRRLASSRIARRNHLVVIRTRAGRLDTIPPRLTGPETVESTASTVNTASVAK